MKKKTLLLACFYIPGSAYDVSLLLLQDDVLLEVEDVYYLLLKFPQHVNEETASATFDKKKHSLSLKVDVLEA